MLYIYGTVYNNKNMVINSIKSLSKINVKKTFLIVDNYSNDGTYETLNGIKDQYNIKLKKIKCSRGLGRQKSVEMVFEESNNNDLFMTFDLDTIYTDIFIKLIEYGIKNIDKRSVFLNQLCYKEVNFNIPWRDLNYGEDWERKSHFIHSGYTLINVATAKFGKLNYNEKSGKREKRYANGITYYKRLIKNNIDLFRAWNISSYKNLKLYMKIANAKKSYFIFLLPILVYIKLSDNVYKYSDDLNIIYVRKNQKIIDIPKVNITEVNK